MRQLSIVFFGTLLTSYTLGWLVYRILRRVNVVDKPNARSSHTAPTVRGGGLAIVLVICSVGLYLGLQRSDGGLLGITVSCIFLGLISFVDDIRPISWYLRFACHATCAIVSLFACGILGETHRLPIEASTLAKGTIWLLVWLWVAGFTNVFNFMDGINGIAASQAVIASLAGTWLLILGGVELSNTIVVFSIAVCGSALGFLPHNYPRPRMFMGDVGSAPLGYLLASLCVWSASTFGWWLIVPLMLLQANFLLDTALTLARRIRRGEAWYEAHREHFYQRLTRAGKSHLFVTNSEIALQSVVVLLLLYYVRQDVFGKLIVGLGIAVIWLLFFVYCEKQLNTFLAKRLSTGRDERDRLFPRVVPREKGE